MRKNSVPVVTRHIPLRQDDWDWLSRVYSKVGGAKPIGTTKVIQAIIHRHVLEMKQRYSDSVDASPQAPSGESEEC